MLRVVLEGEWTKARQGTEEGCCWDAQDKLSLDSVQMSDWEFLTLFGGLLSLGHFWDEWGKYQKVCESCGFWGKYVT